MTPLNLILAILAANRVAHMVAEETGPARVFIRLRTLPALPENVREGLRCPLCSSVWLSALFLFLLRYRLGRVIVAWLAVSGGSAALTKGMNK